MRAMTRKGEAWLKFLATRVVGMAIDALTLAEQTALLNGVK